MITLFNKTVFITLLAASILLGKASAQQVPPLSAELSALHPVQVLPAELNGNYQFNDKSKPGKPSLFTIRQIPGYTAPVITAEVFSALPSHYNVQVTWKSAKPVKKGDLLLARFAMHTVYARQESGDGIINFFMQTPAPSYEKSTMTQVGAGVAWKTFDIPFIAAADMPEGLGNICFSFGDIPQKIEITGLELLNFEKKTTIDHLPVTRFTYNGREVGAEWREAALRRIAKIRTAPIAIKVTNQQGHPVKGAQVKVEMVKSDFIFGSAISAGLLCKDKPIDTTYQKKIKELFNTVTLDNGLKWGPWLNNDSRACTKAAINWIMGEGLRLRGHNLVWPSKKFSPQLYQSRPDFGPGFADSIANHIKDIVTYTKGKVVAWDVINELAHEKDYFDVLPRTKTAEWFKLARQADPLAQLFINEYGMLNTPSSPNMIDTYLGLIHELQGYGAPIDAIGVQGHIGKQPRDPVQVIADLDLLAKAKLPIQITEFDINTTDEELQADYTRDFLIACYSHPAVTGFTMWGFWEPAHWKPDAAMFRKDWTPKLNAGVWQEWVNKNWRTNFVKLTAANGAVTSRGHLGTYQITVTGKTGKVIKKSYHLTVDNTSLEIKI